ncbi:MAG: hypothetical protein OXE94_02025 [Aestuariivita sp.]|nr:hypothetical protein [Aestuariivita sp.]MCY4202172.1 hypothetical protein [Aestuariivita sp.]MCY4289608.1 hypothetical protein [Aestuariivita sp.]MCY4347445.1 hypothetical protein [Aestuariivita sp.]
MESRIDTKLTALGGALDQRQAELLMEIAKRDQEASKRETRLILAMAVIVGVGLAIFGFITAPPTP